MVAETVCEWCLVVSVLALLRENTSWRSIERGNNSIFDLQHHGEWAFKSYTSVLDQQKMMHVAVYPFLGITYFVQRPECWILFIKHLKPILITSFIVYIVIIPIILIISLFTGGIGFSTFPSIIQSCHFIINFITKHIILPKILKRLFDHIIAQKLSLKYNKLPYGVLIGFLPGYYGETVIGRLYRQTRKVFTPLTTVGWLVLLFLINMIPIVGPILVIFVKAPKAGFNKHKRYFQLKGYTNAQIYFLWAHYKQTYFMFGIITLILENIPFLGYIFIFTNTIGAAIWASNIEHQLYQMITAKQVLKSDSTKIDEPGKHIEEAIEDKTDQRNNNQNIAEL